MRTTPHRMRAHAGVCPRVRTLALSMLASRASSASVPPEASIDAAVHGACARGLLGPAKSVDDYPLGFFYDLDAFEANMASLRHAFPPHWHHATAVKTNPLSALLRLTRDAGHGAECAGHTTKRHHVGCRPHFCESAIGWTHRVLGSTHPAGRPAGAPRRSPGTGSPARSSPRAASWATCGAPWRSRSPSTRRSASCGRARRKRHMLLCLGSFSWFSVILDIFNALEGHPSSRRCGFLIS